MSRFKGAETPPTALTDVANRPQPAREQGRPIADSASAKGRTTDRRWMSWCIHVSAWCVVLPLLSIAGARVLYHDGAFPLIWINAFTRYVYLPAYFVLVWAVWQRRSWLTLTSAALACCHLYWLAPDFLREGRVDLPSGNMMTAASPPLRVFFANVSERNTRYAEMLQEIASADPDVIVLVEYGWGWHRAFKNAPVMAPYVYGSGHLQSHIGSVNLFSRRPLKSEIQNWVNGRAVQTVDIELGEHTLRLIGLHGPRPINKPKYDYRGFWQQLIPLLTVDPGPLVIVGDFNITQYSSVYTELTEQNRQSAHEAVGRGYAATWPNGIYWLPPIRIDHAFISPEVECLSVTEGNGVGSDHRPLIVDLRVREAAKTGIASADEPK